MKKLSRAYCLFLAAAILFFSVGYLTGSAPAAAEEKAGYSSIYSSDNPVPGVAERVRPAVVQVLNQAVRWTKAEGETKEALGFGSGVYFDERGYIVTNYHVIEGADAVSVQTLDGQTLEAAVVGGDSGTDIAVLKVEPGSIKADPVPLGDSDALAIGELAIVIGNPGVSTNVLFGTVSCGIISALERENVSAGNFTRSVKVIQIDAAINSGNSGGALLNAKGELVGIPTLKIMADYSGIYEGLGFAIPINTAKPIIEQLIATGKVSRPRIGVSVSTVDGPDEPLRNYAPAGAQVMILEKGGPAARAGLQQYDIITQIDGKRVRTINELTSEIDAHAAGDTVHLVVCRYFNPATGEPLEKYSFFETDVTLEILD